MTPRSGLGKIAHGECVNGTRSPEYAAWVSMRNRCELITMVRFSRYGGRGIRVCERWQRFDLFLADMGRRPSNAHSLDRIDNDADYSPENCRWATRQEQNANKTQRKSKYTVLVGGEPRSISDVARSQGVSTASLYKRLMRTGAL